VHIVRLIVLIAGLGFTKTVTVNALPALPAEQVPKVGITEYTAVWVTLDELLKVPVILLVPVPAIPPVSDVVDAVGNPHV
jgi:hypothetical protein